MFPSDAATYLADFGDPVTWSSSALNPKPSGLMIFDTPDQDIGSGEMVSREYAVTFETSAWAGLKRDDQLVIGGTGEGATYKLRTNPYRVDDGVFSHVKLTKVSP